jgi:hypothetical protein
LRARRMMEKLGMAHEGTLREHVLKWDVYEDLELRRILRSDCARVEVKKRVWDKEREVRGLLFFWFYCAPALRDLQ